MGISVIRYVSEQVRQVRTGGLSIVVQKCIKLAMIILGVPIILLIRIVRPIALVRFGKISSSRIGPFAANIELYLCERDCGYNDKKVFDIFYSESQISNVQLKKMWHRKLNVFNAVIELEKYNALIPGGEKHIIKTSARDPRGLLCKTQPHISFTADEERYGCNELVKLGIPEGASFVCFHVRGSEYLDVHKPHRNWAYHNYRDANGTNCIPAVQELVSRGYYVVRMGKHVREPFPFQHKNVIDYAVDKRTDFLDIYLGAKCHFFLGDTSGIVCIPIIFRRPVAYVNFIPLQLSPTWGRHDLFIPKKLLRQQEHRFLTFREIFNSNMRRAIKSELYRDAGVEPIENTPEEIYSLVQEMDERLRGDWYTTKFDEELQKRFWSQFQYEEPHHVPAVSRIGADYLRKNENLLG